MAKTRSSERQARLARLYQKTRDPLPGVTEKLVQQVLRAEAAAPMRGGDRDLQHDGIFGDSHHQQELFK